MNPFRVGRIRGIELRIHPSWVLIFVLLTWSLGTMFGTWHPDWGITLSLGLGGAASLLFFGCVLLHELAHTAVALAYRIPVRDITLHLFGGLASIEEEPPSPAAEFWIAAIGPAVSIGLALLSVIGGTALYIAETGMGPPDFQVYRQFGPGTTLLLWLGTANFVVALFNLLPGLPLDGGRILRATLWSITGSARKAMRWAAVSGQLLGWLLVFCGILMAFGARVPLLGQGFGAGLWTALIGWFLRGAATESFQSAVLQDLLEGVRTQDVMRTNGPWLPAETTVQRVLDEVFLRRDERAYPVFEGDHFVGVLSVDDLRRVPREQRGTLSVREAMTPRDRIGTLTRGTPLFVALRQLRRNDVDQLPVLEGDHLEGMLHESDVLRWIELHAVKKDEDFWGRGSSNRPPSDASRPMSPRPVSPGW